MTRERERGREMNGEWLGERERGSLCVRIMLVAVVLMDCFSNRRLKL